MQDVDRPDDVQRLLPPARCRGVRVDAHSPRLVSRSNKLLGIAPRLRRRRDVRQHATVRPPELHLAICQSLDLIALFVNGAMVAATEQHEIRKSARRRAGGIVRVRAPISTMTPSAS